MGDSAGHCLPLTAEGIRTALYFGIACGRELRAVVEGNLSVAQALVRYGDFSASHEWKFSAMLRAQQLVPRVAPRLLAPRPARDAVAPLPRLVIRPLPGDRAARVRGGGTAAEAGAPGAGPRCRLAPLVAELLAPFVREQEGRQHDDGDGQLDDLGGLEGAQRGQEHVGHDNRAAGRPGHVQPVIGAVENGAHRHC